MKVQCDPYEYNIKDTSEVISLTHSWEYCEEGESMEKVVHQGKPEVVGAF